MTPETALPIARQMVFGKIKNCRVLMRRNHREPPAAILAELDRLAEPAQTAPSLGTLLGLEGAAARTYFSEFQGMIKTKSLDFDFQGRNRRPPRDPVNAVLSFLYAMLIKQAMVTLSQWASILTWGSTTSPSTANPPSPWTWWRNSAL